MAPPLVAPNPVALLAQAEVGCGPDPSPLCDLVLRSTNSELLARAVTGLIDPLLKTVAVLVLGVIALRLIRRFITSTMREMKDPETSERLGQLRRRIHLGGEPVAPSPRRNQRADALGALFGSIASIVVWGIVVFTIMGSFGIPIGPLLASAGIVGVAVGFGAQDLVKDFLSGVFMLIEDQYGLGDTIDVGEASGSVEGVGLRTTRIRDVYGTLWHVPNGEIRRVGNKSQQWARALMDIDVAYGTDTDEAAEVIKQVADTMWREEEFATAFLEEPSVWGVERLGPDAVTIRLVIKVSPGEQWAITREFNRRLKFAFDAAGIEIPFSQRTVWHRFEDGTSVLDGGNPRRHSPPPAAAPAGEAAPEQAAEAAADKPEAPTASEGPKGSREEA